METCSNLNFQNVLSGERKSDTKVLILYPSTYVKFQQQWSKNDQGLGQSRQSVSVTAAQEARSPDSLSAVGPHHTASTGPGSAGALGPAAAAPPRSPQDPRDPRRWRQWPA